MGKSGSSSQSSTENTTSVETNTSTTIGDIGLTGQDAINLAAVLEGGISTQANFLADVFESFGNEYSQLRGGADNMVVAAQAAIQGASDFVIAQQSNTPPVYSIGSNSGGQIAPYNPPQSGGLSKTMLMALGAGTIAVIWLISRK
jgi:hypothetical protein